MSRKSTFLALSLTLFIALSACAQTPPAPAASSQPAASEAPSANLLPAISPEEELPMPTPSETSEPPLQEADWAIAVPDFLTEEQQLLYRRANNLYSHTRLGTDIEYAGNAPDLSQYETVQIGEDSYYVSKGPYQNWDDFRAVMCSVFTEDYWKRFTDNTSLREYNGQLCFLDTAMGVGYFYDKTSTDTFSLESKTDTEIHFTLIGHYAGPWTQDEINTTGEELHYYTLEFPMLLILTENGWRFDEFHSALLEEDYPF